MIPDVLVVGAGVIGLSVAHELLERGLRVTVLDAGEPGRGASFAAAGVLAPQGAHPHTGPYLDLSLRSRDLYASYTARLRECTGMDVEYRTDGGLHIALDDIEATELETRLQDQQKLGLPVERLSGDEVRRLEPALSPEVRMGLLFRGLHQVENRRLLRALIGAVGLRGGVLLSGMPVRRLAFRKGRVTGVAVQYETLKAGLVVNAAGAWARMLGVRNLSLAPPVKPVRGQMLALDVASKTPFRHVIQGSGQYLVPRRDGRLLVGATVEKVGFDNQVTTAGLAELTTRALRIAPLLASAPVVETWAGLRPMSKDGKPILGPAGIAGLVLAVGHYRNGILLAPITATLIADHVTGEGIAPDLTPFLLERFSPAS
ncbi:MAG: glycine oxidase ThiO [candidate division Zixibacteria bacterium]|nr:glycine oxidase ThiO [candidate division Zixibacteria bacterium]